MRRQHHTWSKLFKGPNDIYLLLVPPLALYALAVLRNTVAYRIPAAATLLGLWLGTRWLARKYRERCERPIVRRWYNACLDAGIANPPEIVRRPNGQLEVRHSAASSTMTVRLRTIGKPTPEEEKHLSGEWLMTLSRFEQFGERLKVALANRGAEDVAACRVHPRVGDKATVVITTDLPSTQRREVAIQGPSGPQRISVLSKAPNHAWVEHPEAGGFVLAQHQHAYLLDDDGLDLDELELADDEAEAHWHDGVASGFIVGAFVWIKRRVEQAFISVPLELPPPSAGDQRWETPARVPLSPPPLALANLQVAPENRGCYVPAGERGAATPPPAVEKRQVMDVERSSA